MPIKRSQAAALKAALSTHLRPLLAVDGAIPQLNVLLRRPKSPAQLAKDAKAMFADKIDIDEAELAKLLKLAYDEADEPKDPDPDAANDEDDDDEDDKKKAKDKKAKDEDDDEDDDKSKAKDKKAKDEDDDDKKDKDDAKAMDAAIAAATAKAAQQATANANAVRQAERDVHDLVGEVDIMDSAEKVYRFALDSVGVPNAGVHASALPTLVKMAKERAAEKKTNPVAPAVAMDSDAAASFSKRFGVTSLPGNL